MSESTQTTEPTETVAALDADLAEHVRLDDPNGLVPRSSFNSVVHALQNVRSELRALIAHVHKV